MIEDIQKRSQFNRVSSLRQSPSRDGGSSPGRSAYIDGLIFPAVIGQSYAFRDANEGENEAEIFPRCYDWTPALTNRLGPESGWPSIHAPADEIPYPEYDLKKNFSRAWNTAGQAYGANMPHVMPRAVPAGTPVLMYMVWGKLLVSAFTDPDPPEDIIVPAQTDETSSTAAFLLYPNPVFTFCLYVDPSYIKCVPL